MVSQVSQILSYDFSELSPAESLQLYERALAATQCGIVISNATLPDYPIMYCNEAFEKITGYSREEVIGKNCRFLQGSETDKTAIALIRNAVQTGQNTQVVLKNYRKDGTPFWNELTIAPVRDRAGNLTHFIGVQQDITARKQEEETRKLMQFSIDCATDAAFYLGESGQLHYVNEAACRLLGYSREALLKLSMIDIDLQFTPQAWEQSWQAQLSQGSLSFETWYAHAQQQRIPVQVSCNYIQLNGRDYICAFARDLRDHQQTLAALRRSESLYRTLAQNIPNGVVLLFDADFRYLVAEGTGLTETCLSKNEIEGKTLWEVFDENLAKTFASLYQKALVGEESVGEYEYWERIHQVYVRPVLDENGQVCAGLVMTQDITEQKHSQSALQRSNTLLQEQKDRLRGFAKREMLIRQISQRIRQSLNLEEVLNTTVHEVRQLLKTDRVILYRFEDDWQGNIIVESVNPQWKSTLSMAIQDHCFQSTHAPLYRRGRVRSIPDIYNSQLTRCHIDLLEQCQVRANLIVPILLGEKLWGLLIAHHCESPRQWQELEIELLQQISIQLAIAIKQAALFEQLEAELEERAKTECALRQSETQLKEKASQLETTLYELQQTQSQLIQSEKMSSLGQLVAGIAHELNNPVSFICGNTLHASEYAQDLLNLSELYQQHYPQPAPEIQELIDSMDFEFLAEDFPKLLNSMKMGTDRIRQIIESLRNFSRLDEAERKPVNIHEGIDNSILILQHRLFSNSSKIKLIKEYGELPQIECYAGQLNQVFMNLISNAIDAVEGLDRSPQIKVATEMLQEDSTSFAVIRIYDNGLGIPEEVRQQIFDPFFTTKPIGKGTGLGLSISYQIVVERHQGQLECHSTPGEGTEFVVKIPLLDPIS